MARLAGWNVTYETITPESAAEGDAFDRGFLEQGVTFREAFTAWWEAREGSYVEPDSIPMLWARWFTAYGDQRHIDGARCNVSLHIPEYVTAASRLRIARLVGLVTRD